MAGEAHTCARPSARIAGATSCAPGAHHAESRTPRRPPALRAGVPPGIPKRRGVRGGGSGRSWGVEGKRREEEEREPLGVRGVQGWGAGMARDHWGGIQLVGCGRSGRWDGRGASWRAGRAGRGSGERSGCTPDQGGGAVTPVDYDLWALLGRGLSGANSGAF